ncbi:MAG: UpxY family transcription antiterminator [Pedobacter sp.]|nr:MAG: UpxY family transcription antiterminator [Pedobacter sp.]
METLLQQATDAKTNVSEKKWLVIYTRARWEKKVDQTLKQYGIESYCPLRIEQRQWADRKKLVELPLFVSYIFVRVNARDQALALYALGVINYVHFMGKPAVVRDHVIEQLKLNLANYRDIEVIGLQDVSIGDRVKIKEGLFNNQSGTVVKLQGKTVLMLLDQINCAIVTRVDKRNLITHQLTQANEN